DKCPTVFGLAKFEGCPDTDGDGVVDSKDACPKVAGTLNGCPDTDKDGIVDSKDKCPKVAGVAANDGCPAVKVVKEETKRVLAQAMEGLFFKTGSSVIQRQSYSVLDNVAQIMIANPDYKLSIEGHTDNTGNEAKNLKLSQSRAAAAKDYLIRKGVSASRLTSQGYGITNPRADNSTSAGRKLNRRVEFKVSF
ncbi:MAG: OmpA family protein, partial [Flavobacteriales bacterium]